MPKVLWNWWFRCEKNSRSSTCIFKGYFLSSNHFSCHFFISSKSNFFDLLYRYQPLLLKCLKLLLSTLLIIKSLSPSNLVLMIHQICMISKNIFILILFYKLSDKKNKTFYKTQLALNQFTFVASCFSKSRFV